MAFEEIVCACSDGVATVTLNRPERLNAYTSLMGAELARAFDELDHDDEVRAIVVTGAGRAFCAGADLASGAGAFDAAAVDAQREALRRERQQRPRPWEIGKPIIAAINGHAVGVGITMTLQWDIRLAAEGAKLAFAFVRRGVIPEALSTWILPRLVGASTAAELLLSGRTLTAREALEHGIVSRVVPAAELLPTAMAVASDIARNTAPVSVAITKRLLWRHLGEEQLRAAEALERQLFDWCGNQPDAREGVRAFLEKRQPQWSMRPSRDLPEVLRKKPL